MGISSTEQMVTGDVFAGYILQYSNLVGALEPWIFMTFHPVGNGKSSQLTNSYFSEG